MGINTTSTAPSSSPPARTWAPSRASATPRRSPSTSASRSTRATPGSGTAASRPTRRAGGAARTPSRSSTGAVVHNGEISSYGINRRYLEQFGYRCALGTDTEVVAYLFDLLMRRHGLPLELACTALASPAVERDRPHERRRARAMTGRCAWSTGRRMLNGPFAIVLGFNGGMVALNDRIKLRPLVAARQGAILMVASEESAMHEVCSTSRTRSGRRRPASRSSPGSRACRGRSRRAPGRRLARRRHDERRGALMPTGQLIQPDSACGSTPRPATSAAAACSSAAGASTPSTSAPSPTTSRACAATAA